MGVRADDQGGAAVDVMGEGLLLARSLGMEVDHDRIRLQPANSELEPIFVSRSEWDQEWQVQGKVVAIFRQCPAA